ncbi:MAG: ABC transporter ATP-binding protein, partial [Pseudomonadota bacterium]
EVIDHLRKSGEMAIILVEQFFDFAHQLGDRFLVMERGAHKLSGTKDEISRQELLAGVSV